MRVLLYHTSCAHCHGTHGAGWLAGDSDCFARSVYTGYALWHSTRTLGKNNCHLRQTAAAYAAGGGTDWTQRFVGCADYRAVHRKHTGAGLAHGISDTPVSLAAKSQLRVEKPVVLAVASNDALAGSASNIAALLNRKQYYFTPMRQDAPQIKPRSLVADMNKIPETAALALAGKQIQPIFC